MGADGAVLVVLFRDGPRMMCEDGALFVWAATPSGQNTTPTWNTLKLSRRWM